VSNRLQLDVRNLNLGRRHLVNAYEIKAGIGVIASKTEWSMMSAWAPWVWGTPVLQKGRYINTLTFTFIYKYTYLYLYLSKLTFTFTFQNVVLIIKRFGRHRWTRFSFTAISCGLRLSYCVWQLDLSTELRKLTSTASLSFYRKSCSERRRTLLTSTTHSVRVAITTLPFMAHTIIVVIIING